MNTALNRGNAPAAPIDLLAEPLFTFAEVAKQVRPQGQRPIHISTLMRWRQTGIRGIQLEAVRLGGRWFTSEAAVSRFISRLNDVKSRPSTAANTANGLAARNIDRAVAQEGL